MLEVGGGTGGDAAWLASQGYKVVLTDASPAMVGLAREKLASLGSTAEVSAAEDLEAFAEQYASHGGALFDGAFSNFAPLNCVEDLVPVAHGLARLVKPGASVMLVLFGTLSPGDMLVECLRGRPHQALRRFRRGAAPARLGGRNFSVRYHRRRDLVRAMRPWFRLVRRLGIGIFVPPSAAEPWISRHPGFLTCLGMLDRVARRPLAPLGDHVLYHFERNAWTEAP